MRSLSLIGFFASVLLAGCVAVPIVETKAFSDSVKTLDSAGAQLFTDVAVAERKTGKLSALSRARANNSVVQSKGGFILTRLNPEDAPYFATIGDPPAVRVFRHAFKVIVAYADTLSALTDGREASAVQGQISELAKSVDALSTSLAILPAPVPGLGALIPIVSDELKPVIGQILAEQSRQEAKALIVRTAPSVRRLIEALKNAAPAMLEALTSDSVVALEAAAKAGQKDERPASLAAAYVTQVANYVVLLDQMRDVFDALVLAHKEPDNPVNLAWS